MMAFIVSIITIFHHLKKSIFSSSVLYLNIKLKKHVIKINETTCMGSLCSIIFLGNSVIVAILECAAGSIYTYTFVVSFSQSKSLFH